MKSALPEAPGGGGGGETTHFHHTLAVSWPGDSGSSWKCWGAEGARERTVHGLGNFKQMRKQLWQMLAFVKSSACVCGCFILFSVLFFTC